MNACLFFLLALFWSGSFIAIKITITYLPPIFSACLRVAIAQLFFTILFLAMRVSLKVSFATAWRLWSIGILLQGLPFLLLFWGECSVAPALASIINATVSAWIILFNILLFHDYSQVRLHKITGLLLGLLGMIIIFEPMLAHQHTSNKLFGTIAITGMALSYAIGGILNQRFFNCRFAVPLRAALWQQHWGSGLFLLLATLIFNHHLSLRALMQNNTALYALVYLGIGSTALAWMIYNHLIKQWGAMNSSSVLFIVPILTLVWDYCFFKLVPSYAEFLGIIIILIGVGLIQFGCRKA